jgi:2',3'-cyclic-nucleotide 2'-phosphodiesterase/3'-nucleotidase
VLTRIDLELERTADGWTVAGWRGTNIETQSVKPDPGLTGTFAETHRDVVEALAEPIGTVTAPVSVRGCRIRDCAAVDLIHTVQLEASGAELSLASLLTDRTPVLPPGPVNRRWVHALYVYPNTLVAVRVTGGQIKDILEHSARFYDGLECGSTDGCTVLTDSEIPHYNVDSMSGVSYRIDPTRPEGDRVRDLRYRGTPIPVHQDFKLVCNNYRATGGGYPHLADADVLWTSSREVTDLIGGFLARNDPWRPIVDGNWWIAREVVAERERDGR